MKIRIFCALVAVALVPAGLSSSSFAQVNRRTSVTKRHTLLAALPASDAVALVNVKRVLAEALPKLLSGNSAKLVDVNSQIEQFKTRTSLDPRAFDELALGMHYSYPSVGITKIDTVAVARGSFNASAIAAAGRVAANGKYREERYQGSTIYIFTLDHQVRLLGLVDFKIRELAIAQLAATTLALGDVERVRSAIDASKGNRRGNAELIALATQDPNAIVGFGGNISAELLRNLRVGNEAIAKDLSAVRKAYGSLGMTDKDLEVLVVARTVSADSARSLSDTVEGLKQFGTLFLNRLSGTRGVLARSALGNLKITTQGNELQIRTAVAQADVTPLVGGL